MTVLVQLFARVRESAGADALSIELTESATVADLRAALSKLIPAAAGLIVRSAMAINGEYAAEDSLVGGQDEVALIPPVSGGQSR